MVTISNGILTAEISERGAELSRLATKTTEYLWLGNPDIWKGHSPVLFPFVGRLQNKEYQFKGKTYGPMPIHGLAPTAQFLTESWEESACTMLLVVTQEMKKLYPFDYDFRVRYELDGMALKVSYLVTNRSEKTMYYGLGGHPGINVPMTKGLAFEDYYVEFPNAKDVKRRIFTPGVLDTGISENYKLENKRLYLKHNLFDNDAVCLENTGFVCVIKTDKDKKSVRLEYPDTKWCAFWHKDHKEAPYVCVEPWFTLPGHDALDDIEKRDDSLILEGGKSALHRLLIEITE